MLMFSRKNSCPLLEGQWAGEKRGEDKNPQAVVKLKFIGCVEVPKFLRAVPLD